MKLTNIIRNLRVPRAKVKCCGIYCGSLLKKKTEDVKCVARLSVLNSAGDLSQSFPPLMA